ncbi:HD domain-containing protein [bacterium]|nr:HD domain-containing protein [bacterium]
MIKEQILKNTEKIFKNAENSHDFLHTKRVLNLVLELAKDFPQIDENIIYATCCFHDVGRTMPKDGVNHAIISADYARENLAQYGFNQQQVEEIASAIETHSWSLGREPKSLLGELLQDGDRIDSLGAIGLARMFSFLNESERILYNVNDPFCNSERKPDDKKYTVDHLFTKLFSIPSKLHTEKAKNLANKRVEFMKYFLEQMGMEIKGEI